MMTAYALARICHELFGDVEYAAIDTDRNKYPIGKFSIIFCKYIVLVILGSGRVVFVNAHSYYAAVTANYLMIECDKFCKVVSYIFISIFFIFSIRFKSIHIYQIVYNVQVLMDNGVQIWDNIFVVHLNV
jgi:hypothetical protein